jgi:hypothetical protein
MAQAWDLTDEIISFATTRSERVYLPELLRMRGELREATDREAALQDYREAVRLAASTGARSLERRASESLAVLLAKASGRPRRQHQPT